MGKNVKVWNLTYIGHDTVIGNNVTIGSLAHIDYDVTIGNNVKIEGLAYLSPLTKIGNNVFIGPGVIFTNDSHPESNKLLGVTVEDEAIIGAGSRLLSGIKIGKNSVIAMGSVVIKDVPANTVVAGCPSRIISDKAEYDKKRIREK